MNLRTTSLLFAFAFAAFPTQAQGPGGGPPAGAGQNIQSLASAVTALTAQVVNLQGRVAKLEGQITASDLVGTYALYGFQSELSGPPCPTCLTSQVASYVFVGTVVLAANSTATINATENGSRLFLGPVSFLTPDQPPPFSAVSTWTYANGIVTTTGGGFSTTLSVAAGGRVLVQASANHADGTNVLLILTRLQ